MWKRLEIAGLTLPNNVLLAPLAGYTNQPFRAMCARLGAGLTFTEMVSCKGLRYGNENTKELLLSGEETPKAAQIFGNDPEIMRAACESEALAPFDLIDVNMGCPMPKIVNNGEGSALLENFPLAERVISSCVKSGKRISVKFRVGVRRGDRIAAEFARLCEGAGACMVTVHGRVREAIYAGEPDYAEIARAKEAVSIPLIANGGVFSRADAERAMRETGADGVMVARAALADPRVFCEILGTPPPPLETLFFTQLSRTEELYGERFATVFMRKTAAFYTKGAEGAAEWKRTFFSVRTTSELREVAERFFAERARAAEEEGRV